MSSKTLGIIITSVALAALGSIALAGTPEHKAMTTSTPTTSQPEELGRVAWSRDWDAAIERAKAEKKPLFVLFTEVPGCSTVTGFGNGPLQDPLLAELIEAHFIPVAVYNNIEGKDREVLESFGEPTWNNPVIRIIDAERAALTERFSGPYSTSALAKTIAAGMRATKLEPPAYLDAIASRGSKSETATLSMYCFWSGEAKLGKLDGVKETRTGFREGREVVEVTYDPDVTSYSEVLGAAKSSGAATGVVTETSKQLTEAKEIFGDGATRASGKLRPSPKDDKKQLSSSPLRFLPVTPWQQTKLNSARVSGQPLDEILSPAQLMILATIKANPKARWPTPTPHKLATSWDATLAIAGEL